MRRRTRPVPFADMRIDSVVRDLTAQPVTDWPKHLLLAWEILAKKRGIDEDTARAVLFASLSAAHRCARAIDRRSRDNTDAAGVQKLQKVFKRIARCIRRSPAKLLQNLDHDVYSSLRIVSIDLEGMDELIDRLIAGFATLPKEEASLTVLRALYPGPLLPKIRRTDVLRRRFAAAAGFLKNDYAALPVVRQRRVESALIKLLSKRTQFVAAEVCEVIASAIDGSKKRTANNLIADLITDYVSEVALIWRGRGLRVGRGVHPLKPNYHSDFHRFAELVLTAVVEPWSKRHHGDQSERALKLREVHARLSMADRRDVQAALSRSDVEWLVSEHHLKTGLSRLQKTTPRTP